MTTAPSSFKQRYGPVAVVTGASSGIGEQLARQLAERGLDLVLVARRTVRLEALQSELCAAHDATVHVQPADLSAPAGIASLLELTEPLDVGLLVNNAGFGLKGPFIDLPLERMQQMVQLNCTATLTLAHHYLGRFAKRGRGGMILTSSTAAWQATPYASAYAATKGFGLQLSEGCWDEMREHGVDVLALCPGPTDTEGPKRTGVDPDAVPIAMMPPAEVAAIALENLGKRPVVVPGLANRTGVLATRLLPRSVITRMAGRLIRRVSGH